MLRLMTILIISIVPFNKIRIFLYRNLLNYKITYSSQIGMFNYINVDKCNIVNAKIRHFNYIKTGEFYLDERSLIEYLNKINHINLLRLGSDSIISRKNVVFGSKKNTSPFKHLENLTIDSYSIIVSNHLFDLSDSIHIGKNVTLGGTRSQLWTHGFDTEHIKVQSPIVIRDNVYIGSSVIILPGVTISSETSIGAGTVVSKSIDKSGFYVSSNLIRKSELQNYINLTGVVEYNGAKFYKK